MIDKWMTTEKGRAYIVNSKIKRRRYGIIKTCPCGKGFFVPNENLKKGNICCSYECLSKYKLHKGFGHPVSPKARAKMSATRLKKFQNGELSMAKENHPCWKGGHRMKNSHMMLRLPGHTMADKMGYVYKYRLRAERALGRPLGTHEVVHHFHDKEDNIMVCTQSYHMSHHQKLIKLNKRSML